MPSRNAVGTCDDATGYLPQYDKAIYRQLCGMILRECVFYGDWRCCFMIVMTTPSYERIPAQVVAASPQPSVEALAVRFTADFCLSIGVTSNIPAK
jgi:hypothetical protein